MIEIIINSLLCVQEKLRSRSKSYQLFGYDFLIDENLNVWLL
jgi:hypothetical protein